MAAVKDLVVKVYEIKGKCPVYKIGDSFKIEEGFKLYTEHKLCLHALSALMPFYSALSRGIAAGELGLAKAGTLGYIQCQDPCSYTGGGTVVFEVTPV